MTTESLVRFRFTPALRKSIVWKLFTSLVLIIGGTSQDIFGADGKGSVSILSSSETGIKFQIVPGSHSQRSITIKGKSYLLFEGVAPSSGEEGKPLLPVEGLLIGIPLNASVSLEVINTSYEVLPRQLVAPAPQIHLDEDLNGHEKFVIDEIAYSKNDWYPSKVIELGDVSQLRHHRVAKILVHPYQYNPATNEMKKLTALTINLRFNYSSLIERSLTVRPAGPDPQFEEVYRNLLLNYEDAKKWRGTLMNTTSGLSPTDSTRDWFDPASPYLKLFIARDGLYKLTSGDLTAAGINVGAVAPQTLKLYNLGVQVPLFVSGESDGVFNDGDYLEFYAQQKYGKSEFYDTYTDTNVYWLTWGGANGLRMTLEPTDTTGTPAITFDRTDHQEQDEQYYFGFDQLEIIQPEKVPGEGWYWKDFSVASPPQDFVFPIDSLQRGSGVPARVKIRFHGMTSTPAISQHTASVTLNGVNLGSTSWTQNTEKIFEISFSDSILRTGNNTLTIASTSPGGSNISRFYLDWFEVTYRSGFKASTSGLTFSSLAGSGSSTVRYTIPNFQSSSIDVYNISDRKKLTGGRVASLPNGTFSITFRDTGSVSKCYIVAAESQKLKPARMEKKQFKDIRTNPTGADYIIIVHELFKQSAQRLASYRAAQRNIRAAVIDVQDIYDEFNYGIFSPEAIKPFLRYVYERWPGNSPAYVLLFGDASWDFKFHFSNTIKRNFVPAHGNPPTDNWFVAFDSTGLIPSMFIGRIPAENVTEAEQVVDKLMLYDQTPPGDWTKSFLFITGGNDDAEKQSFNNQAEFLISTFVTSPPIGGLPYRVYKKTDAIIDGENKQLIQDVISNGTVYLNFIGHSGGRIWGVDAGNPNDLRNTGGQFVFVTSVSCNVAAFADPRSNVLTEDFLFANGRAAVACWAGSSLGYVDIGFILTNSFLRSVTRDSIRSMGKLTTIARIDLWRSSPTSPRVIAGVGLHPLLGDPIAQLALPVKPDLSVTGNDISFDPSVPTEVDSLVKVKARIKNYGLIPKDSVELRVTDNFGGVTSPIGSDRYRLAPVRLQDSLQVVWNVARKSGSHIVSVQIDPANQVDEVTKTNNRADASVQVFSSKVLPIKPVASSIVPRGPQVLEVTNPAAATSPSLKYFFEVDTTNQFNGSGRLVSPAIDAGILSTRWTTPALANEGLYYWRSRTYDGRDSGSWVTSSFLVSDSPTPVNAIRWSENSPKQFLQEQKFQLDIIDSGVTIARSGGIPLYARSVGDRHDPLREYYSVIKVASQTITAFNFVVGTAFVVAEINEIDGSFQYRSYNVPNNSALADTMAQYLRNVSPDRFIAITVVIDGYTNDNENLYTTLESLGARQIRSVRPGDAWAFIAQKRTGFSQESYSKDAGAEVSYVIPSFYNLQKGTIMTGGIGPARRWRSVSWVNSGSLTGTDISLRILGVKSAGGTDTLLVLSKNVLNADLSTVNARTYPTLKLLASLRSDFGTATPLLKSWSVDYEGVSDPAISSQVLRASRDSVLEGETIDFSVDVYNLGYTTVDSVKVNFYILEQVNTRKLFQTSRLDNIGVDGSKTARAALNTTGRRGLQTLLVELDPGDSPELYTINDAASRTFFIRRDTIPPQLEVTFDGAPVVSGDYVSAQPNILIKLFDNSPLTIQDTANVTLRLDNRRIQYAGNPQIRYSFPSSGSQKVEVQYQPVLADGSHTLLIDAADASGNPAGRNAYRVDFTVQSIPKLLNVYNYPNPFSQETNFTFTLTGSGIPDDLTIKIYAVAGRLIRTIHVPLSSLRLGFNRISWDGRDNDGNELANGVYFYTMVLKNGEKVDNITQRLAKVR